MLHYVITLILIADEVAIIDINPPPRNFGQYVGRRLERFNPWPIPV